MSLFFTFSSGVGSKIYAPKIIDSEKYFTKCYRCGSESLKDDIHNIALMVEGKGNYPDALLCGHWPMLVVSDRVVKMWEQNNISGFYTINVRLFRSNGIEILESEASYHSVVITGRSELDLDSMGVEITSKCSSCGFERYNKETYDFGTPIIKHNSWDGNELFVFEQFKSVPMCGIKNLELIYKNKWSNFSVGSLNEMFDYIAESIDLKQFLKQGAH